ncbi:hypothetical protein AXK12_07055 [Cephaloticoccus capnophilus]|uniref:Glycosyltransferase 2-like domain-containing protein n=1 Tax=Cephaloticoccus capnophilus TaxID=1548208 RepID=A0A139SJJ2_9BACT|nr:glycosyltransferase [Cephaloticoccus capnophilus]KXU34693.1 hypothetical protein AXK12_07055 [Cephaloticoccus capnophilus]
MPLPSRETFPLITVGVPTYNRADVLRQMLECLVRQDYPPERLELLVIDNNSPDNTREIVAEFEKDAAEARPALGQFSHCVSYVHEPKQGLGHARNRAIAEARGDIIVLPDDDILAEPDWLRTLCAPLIAEWREGGHSIGCVAGEVLPIFPDGLPDWVRDWHGPQGFRSAEEGAGPLPKTAYPMGANFAFPRWAFERLGPFSTELDRKGASFFGGGDREMLRRIHEADYAVWFVPAARVLHQMPASRTTFRYAARHAFDSARSRVVERARLGRKSSYLVSRFFGNALKALGFAFVALGCALLFQRGAAKRALVRAWRCCGYLYQIARSLFGRV